MTKDEFLIHLYKEFKEMRVENGLSKGNKNARGRYVKSRLIELAKHEDNIKSKEQSDNLNTIDFNDPFLNTLIKNSIHNIKQTLQVNRLRYADKTITEENFMDYVNEINLSPNTFISNVDIGSKKRHYHLLEDEVFLIKKSLRDELANRNNGFSFYISDDGEIIDYQYNLVPLVNYVKHKVVSYFSTELLWKLLENNSLYHNIAKTVKKQKLILDEIPDNFIDLYPKARTLNRTWKLHVGPTNSGKTYQSLERLKEVERGLYLAPLRLLALEVQEKMLESSVLCNLTTGEEEHLIEGATHCSATVEKLDINKHYDVCVIDEAQMIADRDRGWAWTRAILGVCADEVHVCMSEDATNIVCKLIKECGEEFEIIKHRRKTNLVFEKQSFNYPDDVRKNDALVVFSRKAVLAVASELESNGKKVSILYGNLPYKVRKEELRKFREGETDMVVTTDCIGMGMNINVKRIVFLSSHKFDGKQKRMLNVSEVKQIAGRAGRMGMFEQGWVNSLEDRQDIRKLMLSDYQDIEQARLGFPETLININETLSDTFILWSKIPDKGFFIKTDIQRSLLLCRHLERLNFSKEQMLKFISIPFDERNDTLLYLWLELVSTYNNNNLNIERQLGLIGKDNDLFALELDYKKLDLIFSFLKSIDEPRAELFVKVTELKESISLKLINELKKEKNTFKSCNICGRKLPWNYEYGICKKCFGKQKHYRYDFW